MRFILCAGVAAGAATSALAQVLNRQDEVLGPWVPGSDPLEDALAAYSGAPCCRLAVHTANATETSHLTWSALVSCCHVRISSCKPDHPMTLGAL